MVTRKSLLLLAVVLSACGGDLHITPTKLPNAAEGLDYKQALSSDGDPEVTWELASGALPRGLLLGPNTGIISGTPATPGDFSFTVKSSEHGFLDNDDGKQTFTLTVLPKLVAESSLPQAQAGQAYSHQVSATGGVPPYTIDVRGLPGHFTYDTGSHTISGNPTFSGQYPIELDVSDSGDPKQTVAAVVTLVVKPLRVVIATSSPLPSATHGQAYATTLQTNNGAGPFQWSIISGTLPNGLSLNPSDGTISGTPTQTGNFIFNVQVADLGSPPDTATQQFTLTVQ